MQGERPETTVQRFPGENADDIRAKLRAVVRSLYMDIEYVFMAVMMRSNDDQR